MAVCRSSKSVFSLFLPHQNLLSSLFFFAESTKIEKKTLS